MLDQDINLNVISFSILITCLQDITQGILLGEVIC